MQNKTLHTFIIVTIIVPLEHDSVVCQENSQGGEPCALATHSERLMRVSRRAPNTLDTLFAAGTAPGRIPNCQSLQGVENHEIKQTPFCADAWNEFRGDHPWRRASGSTNCRGKGSG